MNSIGESMSRHWFGHIPPTWSIVRAKYLFSEINQPSLDGAEMLLSVSEYFGVRPRQEVISEGDHLTRADSLIGYKKCLPGDLVMNIMLAWKGSLGVSPIAGIVSPSYSVFRPTVEIVPAFFHHLLRSDLAKEEFRRRSTGIIESRLRLYPEDFGDVSVPVPPVNVQHAVANFLNHELAKLDLLTEKKKQIILLLQDYHQGIITQAVTKGLDPSVSMKDSGIDWLGEVPSHWKVVRLKFLGEVRSGVTKGRDLSGKETINLPYLRVANVQDGYLDLSDVATIPVLSHEVERYSLKNGDVLMNEGGDFDKLGRGARWNGEIAPCLHQNHVFAVRPKDIGYSDWINIYTCSEPAKRYFIMKSKQTTNLASISSSSIKELQIPLPEQDERDAILANLSAMTAGLEKAISLLQTQVDGIQEYRQALISEAVTGQIDIREYVTDTEVMSS